MSSGLPLQQICCYFTLQNKFFNKNETNETFIPSYIFNNRI